MTDPTGPLPSAVGYKAEKFPGAEWSADSLVANPLSTDSFKVMEMDLLFATPHTFLFSSTKRTMLSSHCRADSRSFRFIHR